MTYNTSYNAPNAHHYEFLLDEFISLSNMVPHNTSKFVRLPDFTLPTLFVFLGLEFDSGLGYRDFVAMVKFNPYLLQQLGLETAPHFTLLRKSLKRIDTGLLHRMCELLAQK